MRGDDWEYPFESDEAEHRRLILQGEFYHALTKSLYVAAGITGSMRVLDVGCGVGSVALTIAELLSDEGEIVCVDRSDNSINKAKKRLAGVRPRTSFHCLDLADFSPSQPFDAIVGRCVLMYAKEPVSFLRQLTHFLADGGKMVFQEPDHTNYARSEPVTNIFEELSRDITAMGSEFGVHENYGLQLRNDYLAAGLTVIGGHQVARFDGGKDSPIYQLLAMTYCNMKQRRINIGYETDSEFDLASETARRTADMAHTAITGNLQIFSSTLVGVIGFKMP